MRADVFCNNNPIGTIDWMPDACGVQVNLDCAVCGDELLRCYAVVNGNILRVGLPAPEHGRLRLRRHLSRQMLHETGSGRASIQRKRADSADRDRTASAMSVRPEKAVRTGARFCALPHRRKHGSSGMEKGRSRCGCVL